MLPVLFEEQVLGVIELARSALRASVHARFLEQLVETIGVVLNTIIANIRTEELLAQSQRLAQELQVQSVELQRTNAELEDKARCSPSSPATSRSRTARSRWPGSAWRRRPSSWR